MAFSLGTMTAYIEENKDLNCAKSTKRRADSLQATPKWLSKEQLLDVCQLLYRINKHSLALPCHLKETEDIVHKNMRMGIGVTGVLQATEEQRSWLNDTYRRLREFDFKYSHEHGFPESVKLTTVKPSGTLSLLLPQVDEQLQPLLPLLVLQLLLEYSPQLSRFLLGFLLRLLEFPQPLHQ